MNNPFDILVDYERRSLEHATRLPITEVITEGWQGVSYRVGQQFLVSEFSEVIEIISVPTPITKLPGAQPWLVGIGNLRGNLFPVIDLKLFLEGQPTYIQESQRALIIRQAGGEVALLIDELFGQRSFSASQRCPPKQTASGRYNYFVTRAFQADQQEWGVFSLSLLSRTPEFRQAAMA